MIKIEEKEKVNNLYNEVKNIILTKNNESFEYNHKQHHLNEESKYPGISKDFYNENGVVEFENIYGNTIRLEISRWHPHQHNGFSGLNITPCLNAVIYKIENGNKLVLWKLSVESGTLTYKANVSSLEIPNDILQEKQIFSDPNVKDNEKLEEEIQKIDPKETKILFDEIKKLNDKYKAAEQGKEELLLKRRKKIEEITNKIINSYSTKLSQNSDEIDSIKYELNDYEKSLTKYSTFSINLVGKTIQQLISIVENEEYLYKQVTHKFKKRIHGFIDSWDEDDQTKLRIVIKKDKLMNCYDSSYDNENEITKLVKNKEALILSEQDKNSHNNQKITFYTLNNDQIFCLIDFGRFDYIKEFIDSIIQYRFQNDMVEFTEKDMLVFMKKFMIEHRDMIIENYVSKIDEKTLILKLDIS